jgi:hypothetical protein
MRTLSLLMTATLVFCLSCASGGPAVAQDKVSGEQVKQQAEAAFDTAKNYTVQQKDEFQKKMEVELQDLSKRFDELKKQAVTTKGEALAALQAKMVELKGRQKEAGQKLEELKSSSAKAWEDARTKVEQAVDDLKKAYDAVGKSFK